MLRRSITFEYLALWRARKKISAADNTSVTFGLTGPCPILHGLTLRERVLGPG